MIAGNRIGGGTPSRDGKAPVDAAGGCCRGQRSAECVPNIGVA